MNINLQNKNYLLLKPFPVCSITESSVHHQHTCRKDLAASCWCLTTHFFPQTAIETYGIPQLPLETKEDATSRRKELSAALCLLLKVCLSLIHGVHDLQYTAMVTINKVIDACVVHRLAHIRVKASEALQHPCSER